MSWWQKLFNQGSDRQILKALCSKNEGTRLDALAQIERGDLQQAIYPLLHAIRDDSAVVRVKAQALLTRAGIDSELANHVTMEHEQALSWRKGLAAWGENYAKSEVAEGHFPYYRSYQYLEKKQSQNWSFLSMFQLPR